MLEGPLKILSGTGQTIEIYNVSLDGAIRGTLGGDDPLRIECEMEMELPASGGSRAACIRQSRQSASTLRL